MSTELVGETRNIYNKINSLLRDENVKLENKEFLIEIKNMPHKNIALETLKKLLNDEIRLISKKNMVQAKSFMDMR